MALLEFKDLPSTDTPINAQNLNSNFNELKDGQIILENSLESDSQMNAPSIYAVNVGLNDQKIKRIWENSNVNSAFNAQSISFNLNDYEYVIIKTLRYPRDNTIMIYTIVFINEATEINYSDFESGYGKNRAWNRLVTVSNEGISFQNATISGSEDNNALVPYEIWGMKK